MTTLKKHDKKGNLIYLEYEKIKKWFEYDENGNLIYSKNNRNFEFWKEYDEQNRLIYNKNNKGREEWFKYDDKGYRISISKKEAELIKKDKEHKEFISRTTVSRFELLEL